MPSSKAKYRMRSCMLPRETVRTVCSRTRTPICSLASFTGLTFSLGKFRYSHAVGKSALEEGAADIKEDAVFLLASQTKLMTAVAAQQILERGLWKLDDDLAELLPELGKQPVLKGFDDADKPILEPRKVAITLRYVCFRAP